MLKFNQLIWLFLIMLNAETVVIFIHKMNEQERSMIELNGTGDIIKLHSRHQYLSCLAINFMVQVAVISSSIPRCNPL